VSPPPLPYVNMATGANTSRLSSILRALRDAPRALHLELLCLRLRVEPTSHRVVHGMLAATTTVFPLGDTLHLQRPSDEPTAPARHDVMNDRAALDALDNDTS
jgi:hypothetical protein